MLKTYRKHTPIKIDRDAGDKSIFYKSIFIGWSFGLKLNLKVLIKIRY